MDSMTNSELFNNDDLTNGTTLDPYQYTWPPYPEPATCPYCGRCRGCGRRAAPYTPFIPYTPYVPYWGTYTTISDNVLSRLDDDVVYG
jgi:7-cyano-7-deazaguanine synthase in queuosine biosynthesis